MQAARIAAALLAAGLVVSFTGAALADDEVTSFDMINTLLRFGVSNHVELRLSTLYTFKTADTPRNSTSIDGINGLIVGAKIH